MSSKPYDRRTPQLRLVGTKGRARANFVSNISRPIICRPKIVQERLGHADIAMTLNRYSHVTPDMQRSAADTLDAAFTKIG